jgi:hexosaminidase
MYKALILLSFLVLIQPGTSRGQVTLDLIPKPQKIEVQDGVFELTPSTSIIASAHLNRVAKQLKGYLEPAIGHDIEIRTKSKKKEEIELRLEKNLGHLNDEGYVLEVESDKITLSAFHEKGLLSGVQTLRQMLPKQILREGTVSGVKWQIPCVSIIDKPRYRWRGLMLDFSRTYIPKEQIKKYIDVMSFYKMNVLHMHLTDDQGWRIEIEKYPELTQKASKFHSSYDEPPEMEGYYTKADLRELIQYASQRNIEILPEIEMPGHTAEVFSVYPHLTCKGDTFKIHPFFKGPGIHNEIFCAGNEATFEFLENVLHEVIDLFPSQYIHIGGDEAQKKHWEECPICQQRIIEESLKDTHELQSWFIRRIEKYLNSKGRKLIGWDEIMEGGLSSTSSVMYWRGWLNDVPAHVVQRGNDIIMSPTSHCYFDYKYENISTEKVYSFNPASLGVKKQYEKHILGVQANFWSHIDRTIPRIDRQLFPRLLALTEVGWTEYDQKNWPDFQLRLKKHLERLKIMGIYYFEE